MRSAHETSPTDFPVTRTRLSAGAPARSAILVLAGLGMIAAAAIVILAEKSHGISFPVWSVGLLICQGVTGLFGLAVLASPSWWPRQSPASGS